MQSRRARRAGAHAGNLRSARHRRAARWSSASAAPARTSGPRAGRMAHIPLGDTGRADHALSVHSRARPGRQRAHPGREAQRARHIGLSGTPSWSTSTQHADQVTATLKLPDGGSRTAERRLRRRLRRRAQRGAQAFEHRLPRRALRARVLRRRCRDDRHDGSGRGQRLSLARQAFTCSSRCAARITGASSASCRRNSARQGRSRSRCSDAFAAQRGGRRICRSTSCSWFSTYRIHHRARRALSRPPLRSCSATPRTSTARSARRA